MKTDMATPVKDWKSELISDIVVMRGKELPVIMAEGICKKFDVCGEQVARLVVKRLNDVANLPSNIVGAIEKEIAGIEAEKRERDDWRNKNPPDAGTSAEFYELMKFNFEVSEWHRLVLVSRVPDGLAVPMSIEDYIHAGRPQTWSPIIDHWLAGFEKAYYVDKNLPGALLDFLMRYNRNLETERKKRLEELEKAKEEKKS